MRLLLLVARHRGPRRGPVGETRTETRRTFGFVTSFPSERELRARLPGSQGIGSGVASSKLLTVRTLANAGIPALLRPVLQPTFEP